MAGQGYSEKFDTGLDGSKRLFDLEKLIDTEVGEELPIRGTQQEVGDTNADNHSVSELQVLIQELKSFREQFGISNNESKNNTDDNSDSILSTLESTVSDLRKMNYRERTIYDYNYHMKRYVEITGVNRLSEMDKDSLLFYINYNDVKQSTKRVRLKLLKAVLNKWYSEGKLKDKFWQDIKIKVDEDIKEGVSKVEIFTLLSTLDLSDFVELRDACIFLLMWETGIRLGTISRITIDMLDTENKLMNYSGDTMKNHKKLSLPISSQLNEMLRALIRVNKEVLTHNRKHTRKLFISSLGNPINSTSFGQRVAVYKERTGLKNINPHAIRRGFAKRLLDKGVNVAIISKALNHQSIETTTKYLHIDNEEVIHTLRGLYD